MSPGSAISLMAKIRASLFHDGQQRVCAAVERVVVFGSNDASCASLRQATQL